MARSMVFLLLMVTLASVGVLGVLALKESPTATPSAQPSASTSAPPPPTTASDAPQIAADSSKAAADAWLNLRAHELALLEAVLRQIPDRSDISRWLDPSQAARPRLSMPRPDRPPLPYPVLDLPDPASLASRAQTDLNALLSLSNLSLLSLTHTPTNASTPPKTLSTPASGDLAPVLESLQAWLATQPPADNNKAIHGVLHRGSLILDITAIPITHSSGLLWVIAARPIDPAQFNVFKLPSGAPTITLLAKDQPIFSSGPDLGAPLKDALPALAKQSQAPDKLTKPIPAAAPTLASTAVSFPGIDPKDKTSAYTVVFSFPVTAAAPSDAPNTTSPDATATPSTTASLPWTERITSSGLIQHPTDHLPTLLIVFGSLVAFIILGRLLLSLDLRASYDALTRRINVDEPLNRIDLRPFERQLLDATIARHAPRAAAAPQATPISATQEQRLRSENEQMRQDLDSAQSHARQVEKQLEFARKKIQDTSEEARLATTNSIALQNQLTALQNQLASLQSQPQSSGSPSNSQENPSTRRPPPPKPGQTPPNRSGANKSSAVPSASSVSSANPKDFDTAEVSNEDMSHLLDGGFDSTASPTLPPNASISELAQQIGSMSPSQIAKIPDAPALKSPRSSTDPAKITAMGLPRAELIPNFPTPHQPGISEEARRASAKNPKEEEDYGLTERIDRASLRLDIPSKPKPGDKPAPSKPSPLQTQPLSSGLFSADDDITVSTPDSAVPPSPAASNTSNANIRPRRPSLASAPQALSPAGLLEALKRRGQQEPPPANANPNASGPNEPATRVTPMSITRELLDQSRPEAPPDTLSHSGVFSRTGSKLDIEPANDSEYFKALYEDFLSTKRACGESTDNITMERFVNRLARNKQALVDRYNCGTVRFQVYVKDGRAALKATPVK